MARQSKLVQGAPHSDVSYRIIGAAMAVHNEHGPGHREEFYHQARRHKLADPPFELAYEHEADLPVEDDQGQVIFVYRPDFQVEASVLLEVKARTHPLTADDIAQVIDYFAAWPACEVALLVNFGRPRLEWKRLFPPKHLLPHRRRQWRSPPR